MRGKITKRQIDGLLPGQLLADSEIRGFVARRLKSGRVSYGFRYRDKKSGGQRWMALGLHGSITADQARSLAKKRAGAVADQRDPVAEIALARSDALAAKAAEKNTVNKVLDEFLIRYVRGNRLRSAKEIARTFDKYVRPKIGSNSIYSVRRNDIVSMLDWIEDKHGPVMADRTLAHVRKAFNWQATRDDRFVPPIVRGMARTKPKERARKRILSDEEIRDLFEALDTIQRPSPFPNCVRALLLTAQRREDVAQMRWEELDADVWTIPAERCKSKLSNVVPLTKEVLKLLGEPRMKGYVFSTTGGAKPFSGFSKAKQLVDRAIAQIRKRDGRKPMPPWVMHDLRRTARSMLSRVGVSSDIGERVIGHVIPGVRGVYDRHDYAAEKLDALERLAQLISAIRNPADNVVSLSKRHDHKM